MQSRSRKSACKNAVETSRRAMACDVHQTRRFAAWPKTKLNETGVGVAAKHYLVFPFVALFLCVLQKTFMNFANHDLTVGVVWDVSSLTRSPSSFAISDTPFGTLGTEDALKLHFVMASTRGCRKMSPKLQTEFVSTRLPSSESWRPLSRIRLEARECRNQLLGCCTRCRRID